MIFHLLGGFIRVFLAVAAVFLFFVIGIILS